MTTAAQIRSASATSNLELVEVSERLARAARPGIVAGHYCINPDLDELSSDGESEQASMRFGAALYRRRLQAGRAAELVLWVNDIGITPEERRSIKASYVLPERYQEIVADVGVRASEMKILFESTMRNKASTLLRKIAGRQPERFQVRAASDPSLVRCVENAACELEPSMASFVYSVPGPDQRPLVVKEGPNPKCNLILGTLYRHLTEQLRCDMIVNVFNSIYVNRIQLGIHVSRVVFDSNVAFVNMFCDAERLRLGTADVT